MKPAYQLLEPALKPKYPLVDPIQDQLTLFLTHGWKRPTKNTSAYVNVIKNCFKIELKALFNEKDLAEISNLQRSHSKGFTHFQFITRSLI
jgi:hypothetical protein